jgi:hypothetical protein
MVMFKEGQIVAWGVRIVTIQGLTKIRGDRKYHYVLELWSEEDRNFRMENGLKEPYDGLYWWVPEDQMKMVV